jgi:hypothetical protein
MMMMMMQLPPTVVLEGPGEARADAERREPLGGRATSAALNQKQLRM